MLPQIGFCGVSELHFDAPAVDRMHAFKFFSATGTRLFHRQKKAREVFASKNLTQKNINYLNNIALGMTPASNELSSTPSKEKRYTVPFIR